jgi:hypothetical protein
MEDGLGNCGWRRQRGDLARAPRRLIRVVEQHDVDLRNVLEAQDGI